MVDGVADEDLGKAETVPAHFIFDQIVPGPISPKFRKGRIADK